MRWCFGDFFDLEKLAALLTGSDPSESESESRGSSWAARAFLFRRWFFTDVRTLVSAW